MHITPYRDFLFSRAYLVWSRVAGFPRPADPIVVVTPKYWYKPSTAFIEWSGGVCGNVQITVGGGKYQETTYLSWGTRNMGFTHIVLDDEFAGAMDTWISISCAAVRSDHSSVSGLFPVFGALLCSFPQLLCVPETRCTISYEMQKKNVRSIQGCMCRS